MIPTKKTKRLKVPSAGSSTRDAVETAISLAKKQGRSVSWEYIPRSLKGRFTKWGQSFRREEPDCKA